MDWELISGRIVALELPFLTYHRDGRNTTPIGFEKHNQGHFKKSTDGSTTGSALYAALAKHELGPTPSYATVSKAAHAQLYVNGESASGSVSSGGSIGRGSVGRGSSVGKGGSVGRSAHLKVGSWTVDSQLDKEANWSSIETTPHGQRKSAHTPTSTSSTPTPLSLMGDCPTLETVLLTVPEMVEPSSHGLLYGQSVDVWVLGLILYTCLVGRPPIPNDANPSTFIHPREYETSLQILTTDADERAKDMGSKRDDNASSSEKGTAGAAAGGGGSGIVVSTECLQLLKRLLAKSPLERPSLGCVQDDVWLDQTLVTTAPISRSRVGSEKHGGPSIHVSLAAQQLAAAMAANDKSKRKKKRKMESVRM